MPFPAVNVLGAGGGFGFVEVLGRGVDDFDVEVFLGVVRTGAGAVELRGLVRAVVTGRGVVRTGRGAVGLATGFLVVDALGGFAAARDGGGEVVVTTGPPVVLAPAVVLAPVVVLVVLRPATTSRVELREGLRKADQAVPPTTARVAATAAATSPRRTRATRGTRWSP